MYDKQYEELDNILLPWLADRGLQLDAASAGRKFDMPNSRTIELYWDEQPFPEMPEMPPSWQIKVYVAGNLNSHDDILLMGLVAELDGILALDA